MKEQPSPSLPEKKAIINIAGDLEEEKIFSRQLKESGSVSRTIMERPDAVLDFSHEADLYAARINRSAEDRKLIERFQGEVGLNADVQTITAIPVYVAESDLQRTLEAYASQGDEILNSHHVVIFLNAGPTMDEETYRTLLDERKREIADTAHSIPNLTVSVIDYRFQEKVVLGRVRGIMGDAIIAAAREQELKDPVLVSNDADQLQLSPVYMKILREAYAKNPSLDATAGPIYWGGYGPKGNNVLDLDEVPELFLGDAFLQSSDAVVRSGEGGTRPNFYTSGPNSSVRLSALCAMGGYDYDIGFKEEVEIGRRAKAMRMKEDDETFYHSEHLQFLDDSYVITSPRRSFEAVLNGKVVIEQWDNFDDIIGSDLDIKELAGRYQTQGNLLQKSDLLEMRQGNPQAIQKVQDRVKAVFVQSAIVDGINTVERLNAVADRFGLKLSGSSFSNSVLEDVTVDWESSQILDHLNRIS